MRVRAVAPGPLPTFLIIGAMKAGTTSLYHYVRAHPQVFMPAYKAPEFFAQEPRRGRTLAWYQRQFAPAGPDALAIGEASNVYTKYPTYQGVPERMRRHVPDVRLVYVVRDPVERIRSHYQTRFNEGSETAPFDTAVFADTRYVDYSRYAWQIEQYLRCFPREQLLVVTAEDLRHDRRAVVAQVYGFLGVDPSFVPADLDREFYRTQEKPVRSLVPLSVRKTLKRHLPAAKRFKELEGDVLRAARRVTGRGEQPAAVRIEVPAATRQRLHEVLADDVRALRGHLGPDFAGWGIA